MTAAPDVRSGPVRSGSIALHPWRLDDTADALAVFGDAGDTRWPGPQLDRVPDLATMRELLARWIDEDAALCAPHGRWAVRRLDDDRLIGGASLLRLPPGDEDTGMAWQLHPGTASADVAGECAFALASLAFDHGLDEVFALVRAGADTTAIRRNGMYWVGETGKYFGLDLQVYRLRAPDLDRMAAEGHHLDP
ncbi:GNAT family N-acetyltransferase [Actinokineospora diospyrosa]|uniref:Acetyltransferase (GNAT) domain-containing protein n=1 Tax=Actinokineospora diospyrosa TaxID=103728 RepID=A0ABT1IIR6_9PSEU|nr:GNAT family N-acetyltransferase [Actinokineospora diospyrosa]MCP2272537.1 Acetyltransferase (GNAT) domain-containing protein [Actinokineospora diospyrosa]